MNKETLEFFGVEIIVLVFAIVGVINIIIKSMPRE